LRGAIENLWLNFVFAGKGEERRSRDVVGTRNANGSGGKESKAKESEENHDDFLM
jgi:hypothetical protein